MNPLTRTGSHGRGHGRTPIRRPAVLSIAAVAAAVGLGTALPTLATAGPAPQQGAAETSPVGFGEGTTPPYKYTAEPASSVVASVTGGAGAGKL
ncbi:hypothetical protein [Streptomyces sp. NPDC048442]|uniref:hypothetical protein n=1 Tax=Streptomyces sp. NPDC048442 TaxID=3154823 RepID=UPI003418C6F3